MLLRSAVVFGLAAGMCLAANVTAFQDAIKRAIPSPFSTQTGQTIPEAPRPDMTRILSQPDLNRLVLESAHTCSIPLASVPVSKSNDPIGRSEMPRSEKQKTHSDEMVKAPAVPACPVN